MRAGRGCQGPVKRSGKLEREVVREFAAAIDPDLGEDCFEVILDGVGPGVQGTGDLPGAQPREDAADHLLLAVRQPVGDGQDRQHGVPPTGRRVSYDWVDMYRVTDGRIVWRYLLRDWKGLRDQLTAR